jgi:hypothetical protein
LSPAPLREPSLDLVLIVVRLVMVKYKEGFPEEGGPHLIRVHG